MEEWEQFFCESAEPANFKKICDQFEEFCLMHKTQRSIILLTSGGTTVPLERNTVRFVDNFSAGTRGSASTEYFISLGYAVIFLNREKSVQPFERHLNSELLFNSITEDEEENLHISGVGCQKIKAIYHKYKEVKEKNLLLKITFVSLTEYLWLLRAATQVLNKYSPKSLLYLAAAVSDFYIPQDKVTEHKIQSGNAPLCVTLQIVPKMLQPLVTLWGPTLFTASFKLETDGDKLVSTATKALEKYKHNLVIGNLLHTRRTKVTFVTKNAIKDIELSKQELEDGVEIEQLIVDEVDVLFKEYQKQKS